MQASGTKRSTASLVEGVPHLTNYLTTCLPCQPPPGLSVEESALLKSTSLAILEPTKPVWKQVIIDPKGLLKKKLWSETFKTANVWILTIVL